jgi:hypothetical protein
MLKFVCLNSVGINVLVFILRGYWAPGDAGLLCYKNIKDIKNITCSLPLLQQDIGPQAMLASSLHEHQDNREHQEHHVLASSVTAAVASALG